MTRFFGPIAIGSDRLRVVMARPGDAPNTTTRFDRAGFVTDIILDGKHHFCAGEPNNLSHPSSGGRGLCSEYKFDISGDMAVGEWFPKPGVGLLQKKDNAPYDFAGKYELQPFPVRGMPVGPDRALFETHPLPCVGYGVIQHKEVSVEGNRLTITTSFTNAGQHEIKATEYNHNFISLNGMALGPDYEVAFDHVQGLDANSLDGIMVGDGSKVRFAPYRSGASFAEVDCAKHVVPGPRTCDCVPEGGFLHQPFCWRMLSPAAGVQVRVTDDIDLCSLALWASDHMVSVEAFHNICLQPGQTSQWARTWVFDTL